MKNTTPQIAAHIIDFDDATFDHLSRQAEQSAETAKADRKALTDAAKAALAANAAAPIDASAAMLAADAAKVASLFGYSAGTSAHGALGKAFISKVAAKARKAF